MFIKIEDINLKKINNVGKEILQVLKDNNMYQIKDDKEKIGIKFLDFEISKRK